MTSQAAKVPVGARADGRVTVAVPVDILDQAVEAAETRLSGAKVTRRQACETALNEFIAEHAPPAAPDPKDWPIRPGVEVDRLTAGALRRYIAALEKRKGQERDAKLRKRLDAEIRRARGRASAEAA